MQSDEPRLAPHWTHPQPTFAYRLGTPRFTRYDLPALSVPVTCRRVDAALMPVPAARRACEWLHELDILAAESVIDFDAARIFDLDWPTLFRDRNPHSPSRGRIRLGRRCLVEFPIGDMLQAAVTWRAGRGRLRPLPALAQLPVD
ncbi:MAG TPA: hypothetical protein VFQ71_03475 [Gaiellales bacterium]|jgi:hypothetical protein|nr:hypothetical protein [Gaiellales bacterium]